MKVICVGDSNTYGYDPRNFWGGRYDAPWPKLLAEATGWETVNLGQNGREIPCDGLEIQYLDRQIQQAMPADVITVMLGTNDLLMAVRPRAEVIARRMEEYLCHLREQFPEADILLIAPGVVHVKERDIEGQFIALIECYQELAQRLSFRFANADSWNLPMAYDSVHLTEEAHLLFAQKIAELLH